MKKLTAIILALLMLTALFAACGEKMPTKDPENPEQSGTQTDPQDLPSGGEIIPAGEKLAAGTKAESDGFTYVSAGEAAAWETKKMLILGDGVITANNMGDIMVGFARADGFNLEMTPLCYDNLGTDLTFNIYELFNWSSEDADALLRSPLTSSNAYRKFSKAMQTPGDIDYFVVLSSRDRGIGLPGSRGRVITASAEMYRLYKAANPDGNFVLLAPYGFQTGSKWFSEKLNYADMTRTEHNEKIKALAADTAAALGGASQTAQLGDAFEYFLTKYPDAGVDLYDASLRTPSVAGSYYTACCLYASLFGKSPVGIPFYGFLDTETAVLMQTAAHEFIFGTDPAAVKRGASYAVELTVPEKPDPREMTESASVYTFLDQEDGYEYPEYYDELMSTIYAYKARGAWTQYDNMNMDRVNKTFNRRGVEEASPEDATPQHILYTDCSAFLYSAFADAFGTTFTDVFGNRTRCSTMYNLEDDCRTFYWDSLTTEFSREESVAAMLEVLQPGDLFICTDGTVNVGHIMLYIGNGMMMHCTGRHASGGGENYIFDNGTDAWEMDGAILYDSIDEALVKGSWLDIFRDGVYVSVLSPLSIPGLAPTEKVLARMNNFEGMIAYKNSSAPEGTTVSDGGEVTFDFVVRNTNDAEKSICIKDTLPEGLTFKSGEGSVSDGVVTIYAKVPAKATMIYSYTVEISADAGTTILCDGAYINGVKHNNCTIVVGNTLSADEQTSLATAAKNASAADDFAFVSKVYEDAFGYKLPAETKADLHDKIFYIAKLKTFAQLNANESVAAKMVASNLFGGDCFAIDGNNKHTRSKYFNKNNLVTGDIIFYCRDYKAANSELALFLGDRLITVRDGKVVTLSASSTDSYIEALFGSFCFAVLRPSLTFGETYVPSVNPGSTDETGKPTIPAEKIDMQAMPASMKMLVFGDKFAMGMQDMLTDMAKTCGTNLEIISVTYDNSSSSTSSYNLYELFDWSEKENPSATGTLRTKGNALKISKALASSDKLDAMILLGSRDYGLSTSYRSAQSATAASELKKMFLQHNPDGKFFIIAPPGFADGYAYFNKIGGGISATSYAEHTELAYNYAEAIAEGAPLINMGAAYTAANLGKALYEGTYLRHPSALGDYLNACCMFRALFVNTPIGKSVPAGITLEDAAKVQLAALSCMPEELIGATDVEPSKPSTPPPAVTPPTVTAGDFTEKAMPAKMKIAVFGDSFMLNSKDELISLAAQAGCSLEIVFLTYDNTSSATSSYNLHELFNWSDKEDPNATCTGIKDTSSNVKKLKTALAEGKFDAFVIMAGRDYTLGENYRRNQALVAAKELNKILIANNPEGKCYIIAAPGFDEGYASYAKLAGGLPFSTTAQHTAAALEYAQMMANGIENAVLIDCGAAYASVSGIELYEQQFKRHSSENGDYLTACCIFRNIFTHSPVGLTQTGSVTESAALALQTAALNSAK